MDIKHYNNIHKNKDIYVLASGKSVDFIDNSFFGNKIIIGVNQAYKKVKCSYLVRKEYKLIDESIRLNPTTLHFISKGDCGANNNKNISYIKENNIKCVVYNHDHNTCSMPPILPDNDKLVVSYSTITTAIHLAAYMGAKNIILIGHDCGTINNEPNFKNYHNENTYKISWKNGKKDYTEWLKKIESQTIQLKKMLYDKYKCNIYSLNPFINFNLEGNIYKK
jgi:hypothetical protein